VRFLDDPSWFSNIGEQLRLARYVCVTFNLNEIRSSLPISPGQAAFLISLVIIQSVDSGA
jgi:hypothetical protein